MSLYDVVGVWAGFNEFVCGCMRLLVFGQGYVGGKKKSGGR